MAPWTNINRRRKFQLVRKGRATSWGNANRIFDILRILFRTKLAQNRVPRAKPIRLPHPPEAGIRTKSDQFRARDMAISMAPRCLPSAKRSELLPVFSTANRPNGAMGDVSGWAAIFFSGARLTLVSPSGNPGARLTCTTIKLPFLKAAVEVGSGRAPRAPLNEFCLPRHPIHQSWAFNRKNSSWCCVRGSLTASLPYLGNLVLRPQKFVRAHISGRRGLGTPTRVGPRHGIAANLLGGNGLKVFFLKEDNHAPARARTKFTYFSWRLFLFHCRWAHHFRFAVNPRFGPKRIYYFLGNSTFRLAITNLNIGPAPFLFFDHIDGASYGGGGLARLGRPNSKYSAASGGPCRKPRRKW